MTKRILIIDDDKILCKELAEFLNDEGLIADYALDSLTATSLLSKNEYALVLLDYKMPQKTGIEFMMENKELLTGTKLFMMSGSLAINKLIEESGHAAMVNDVFCKPFQIEDVFPKIKSCLK